MLTKILSSKLLTLATLALAITSCKKPEDPTPAPKFSYSNLTSTTPYDSLFVNSNNEKSVDVSDANNRLNMFKAWDAYAKTSAGTGTAILDANVMKNMFSNTGNPFTGIYSYLNTATGIQLRNVTASASSNGESNRTTIEGYFTKLANASAFVTGTASSGVAGKLGNSLVDEKGIEWGQVIAKALMGAYQYDYIANVLFSDEKLNADNQNLVSGKKYTQLEHNWDEAYGTLTLNKVYAGNATATSNGGESFIGSYLWQYNKDGYTKIHPAFLKGRAAIVNNDRTEAKAQADIIKKEMEKAIASAAIGYLAKWKTGTSDDVRARAIGEGLGCIYALRYCKVNGGDDTFSDNLLNNLVFSSTNGFWDLTNDKINTASDAIKAKFGLQ
ncbi:MAG: DUF4856 domain-containing protein [Cytophagales bacterium]|nr:DUF4856 domain-containing protein [Cytophagales bacterium]